MFPVGAIFSLLGQGASGVMSILNNKRIQQASDANAAAQRAELNAQINENPLSRSENQHILGQYDREAQRQAEVARNMSVIKGATPEFSAAVQKGIAESRANLMGDMAARASGRSDQLRRELRAVERNKYAEDQERRAQRNATYAALAGNAAGALGAIMDGYSAPEVPKEDEYQRFLDDRAVDVLNKPTPNTGVSVKSSPTSISQELEKIKSGLAVK